MSLGVHVPWAGWLALLVIPLVAVYFLKLKRPTLAVPSLLLWRQVMADQRVNSPFQRFRRNLLLWLQLLALLGLILAALQPFFSVGASASDRTLVIVDCSASMAARQPGGKTAADAARAKVQALIDGLGRDQQLCLLAMAGDARRLTGFTGDRRELTEALARCQPVAVVADPAAAVRSAQALSRTTPFARAVLVSDGNLPAEIDADLAFPLDYWRVDPGGPNLGITACGARRERDGWEVFVAVSASGKPGDAVPAAALELLLSGSTDQVLERRPVAPAPGGSVRIGFHLDGASASDLTLRLVGDAPDSLASDDQAWLSLPAVRPVRAWVAPDLPWWRKALEAQPGVVLSSQATGDADLLVARNEADLSRPAVVTVGVGAIPAELRALVSVADEGGSAVVDVRADEPVLTHVGLLDLVVTQASTWTGTAGEGDLEQRGWRILVHGDHGPLVVAKSAPNRLALHFLIDTDRTTLPWRLGFPVLAGNLVAEALRRQGALEIPGLATGVLPPLAVRGPVTITRPDGTSTAAEPDGQGQITGIAATVPGLYRIDGPLADGSGSRSHGVSLLDPAETSLAVVDKLQLREVPVIAGSQEGASDWEVWPWLALLALLALLVEWWVAHRRVGVRV